MLLLSRRSGCSGLFKGREATQAANASVHTNGCLPAQVRPQVDTDSTRGVVATNSAVLCVFRRGDGAQVGDPVVGPVSVYVINLSRPFAMPDCPCHAMGRDRPTQYGPRKIPGVMTMAERLFASMTPVPTVCLNCAAVPAGRDHLRITREPEQFARLRIVAQQAPENFGCWVVCQWGSPVLGLGLGAPSTRPGSGEDRIRSPGRRFP